MFGSSGVQALKSYSTQARAGEILTSKRKIPDFPLLTGADNVKISGRSMALAVAKSFTARLAQAQVAEQPSVSQAIASNIQSSANIQEATPIKKREREEKVSSLPKGATLGFSTMSDESIEKATKEIKRLQEPPPDKYHTRIHIDDFSLKFIRALNPIPA